MNRTRLLLLASFVLGFFVANLSAWYCAAVIQLRSSVGIPISLLAGFIAWVLFIAIVTKMGF